MKKALIFIFLFSFLACEKNDPKPISEKYTTQEIAKAIIGVWRPSRLAYDEDFKNIEYVETDTCAFKYNIAFNSDRTGYEFIGCSGDFTVGTYIVLGEMRGGVCIRTNEWSAFLSSNVSHGSEIILHHFTDSTLIFSDVSYGKGDITLHNMYSEFKRVKE